MTDSLVELLLPTLTLTRKYGWEDTTQQPPNNEMPNYVLIIENFIWIKVLMTF